MSRHRFPRRLPGFRPPSVDRYSRRHAAFRFGPRAWKDAELICRPWCAYCRRPFMPADPEATIDHVMPLGRGGRDVEGNRVLACRACNNAKGDLLPLAFLLSPARPPLYVAHPLAIAEAG